MPARDGRGGGALRSPDSATLLRSLCELRRVWSLPKRRARRQKRNPGAAVVPLDRSRISLRSIRATAEISFRDMRLYVLAMRLRTRAFRTPKKPSQKQSQELPPSKRKKGGGAPKGAPRCRIGKRCGAHPVSVPQIRTGPRPLAASWSGRARLSAPHRGTSPAFTPARLGRASWNHRIQAGGPSPAPVQRAPRSPACAGRDVAQAARAHGVSPCTREPPPLRPKEYPREWRPSSSGILSM